MSLYSQLNGILAGRNELDDMYNSKAVFRFNRLQGPQDGSNLLFQIPQDRVVVYNDGVLLNLFPQIYIDNSPLVFNTDYSLLDALKGIIQYTSGKQPGPQNSQECTFNWVWFTDVEWDRHLNRAANEIGFTTYYTQTSNITGADPLPSGGSLPADVPDGLFTAIVKLAASFAARSLSLRFSTKYDTSAGDQSFSPSQMAKSFDSLADKLEKAGYNARDDFYKGQGRQYRPAILPQGYVLPPYTPPR